MERNRGKPDFQPDDTKDEENVNWDQFNQWEKLYLADMMADKDDMFCLWNVAIVLKIMGLINLLTRAIHILNRREKTLIIITADKETFNVELEVARQSQTIRNMLDDLNITEAQIGSAGGENTLPLTNEEITGPLLKKALIWMEKNRGKPDFQPDDKKNAAKIVQDNFNLDQLNQWEKSYLADKMAYKDEMLRLLKVACILEIMSLINLLTIAVSMFKRREKTLIIKTADKKTFHVEFEVARQSQTIRNMLDDLNIQEGGDGDKILPLNNAHQLGLLF